MISKLVRTQSTALQSKDQTQNPAQTIGATINNESTLIYSEEKV